MGDVVLLKERLFRRQEGVLNWQKCFVMVGDAFCWSAMVFCWRKCFVLVGVDFLLGGALVFQWRDGFLLVRVGILLVGDNFFVHERRFFIGKRF